MLLILQDVKITVSIDKIILGVIQLHLNNLIDLDELSVSEIDELITTANKIRENPWAFRESCRGKVMATLFYEPSTRTKMSFQTAMYRLGGEVVGFDNPQNTSVSKGESLKDTITVVSGYTDLIVMRNPMEGAAAAATFFSKVPIINAGDGGHLHPTQTLTDLVTLYNEKGRLDHLCIGLCGDLKYGRTVHSLIKTMTRYEGNSFVLISTPELALPQYVKDVMDAANCKYTEINNLADAIGSLDVLYMTRIQMERFATKKQYEEQKGIYVLDSKKLSLAKKDMKILHPLPRVDEITLDIDNDERAKYFDQTVYGMYARMALILTTLKNSHTIKPHKLPYSTHAAKCKNPKCITQTEKYLPNLFKECGDMLECKYCDDRMLI